jgi:hypothetical protein
MQVVQTVKDPPNQGRIYFPMISSTWKRRKALKGMTAAKDQISRKENLGLMASCGNSNGTALLDGEYELFGVTCIIF